MAFFGRASQPTTTEERKKLKLRERNEMKYKQEKIERKKMWKEL
jgi:hypothetical protein